MILGIDPGRNKCGVAVLTEEGKEVLKEISKTSDLSKKLEEILENYSIDKIILGNGTYADKIYNILKLLFDEKKIIFINEENSTYIAEKSI